MSPLKRRHFFCNKLSALNAAYQGHFAIHIKNGTIYKHISPYSSKLSNYALIITKYLNTSLAMSTTFTKGLLGTALTSLFIACSAYGQVPVTTGLKLHLQDAGQNFTPASGNTPAEWLDNSGSGNTVYALTAATSPTLSTGLHPGVDFNGMDQFMTNAAPNNSFNAAQATIFVVRITSSDTIQDQNIPTYQTTVSIGENNSWNDEMSMQTNAIAHHSSSGNWTEKRHQCYPSLPETEPAIITGIFNSVPNKVDMQVNGISSTRSILNWGAPWNMANMNRRIRIGGRTPSAGSSGFFFTGKMLEVIAYDHVLTAAEITSVTDYLKCKHDIKYAACNNPIDCSTPTSITNPGKQRNVLYQNTANPFIGSTTVSFIINNMTHNAAITISDLNGRILRRYPISHVGSGSVQVSAEGMAPGMYFYSLTVDGAKIDTKRMVLSK